MATNNCSKNLYTVSFTDQNKDDIFVSKGELITDRADIAFVGKTKRDYGEIFNENVLHLLENFACPEDPLNVGNPDLSVAFGALLENPIEGQVWFNTTQGRPFRYNGIEWLAMGTGCDVAGNYGVLAHGQQLPHPVCPVTGYVFQYEECSWVVSPFTYEADINYMSCYTDENAVVNMQYRPVGGTIQTGMVNYQIIGISGNVNGGTMLPLPSGPAPATPTPTPNVTASPFVTPTPTVTPGSSQPVTPTVTPTMTRTPSVTPTNTPAPGVSITPSPAVTATPTGTPASTPPNTPNPTQSSTPDPTSTPEVTPTSEVTPTPTLTVTPSITPSNSFDPSGLIRTTQFNCHKNNAPACITLNSSGTVTSGSCSINSSWVTLPFRSGEDGGDYTFTATKTFSTPSFINFSGATSGNFSLSKTWCLAVPPNPEGEYLMTIEIDISGPGGDSGTVTLHLSTINTGGFETP